VPSALIAINAVADYPAKTALLLFQIGLSIAIHLGVLLAASLYVQAGGWWAVRAQHHLAGMSAHGHERAVADNEEQTRVTTWELAQIVEDVRGDGLDWHVGPLPDQTVRWVSRCFRRDFVGRPSDGGDPPGHGDAGGSAPLPPPAPNVPPDGNGTQAPESSAPGPAPAATPVASRDSAGDGDGGASRSPSPTQEQGDDAEAEYLRSILDAQSRHRDGELS